MIKLAVTGNIASGKTLVENILKEQGILTLDSDQIVHDLLKNNPVIKSQIFELFQNIDISDENNEISRTKVGKIVFKDAEKRKKLEEIIHPIVKTTIEEFFDKNNTQNITAVVVPLLFEANMQNMFDYIMLVTANIDVRIERLIKRNKLSTEEAMSRINCQMPQDEKVKKSDFIIDSNLTAEKTKDQVISILNKLKTLI
jgi:dephospho-CoA kinase